jgi:LDH2 family malate/lactate/ureidoglycolate dehydrogenase
VDFNADLASATNTGHAIMAIDIKAFGPVDVFKKRTDALIRDLRNSKRAPGVERIWFPGEQSNAVLRERTAKGIPLHPELVKTLYSLALDLGVARLD